MALSAGAPYEVELSPASVARFAALMRAAPIMAKYYEIAMNYAVNAVKASAIDNATPHVVTGTLRRGIVGQVQGPLRGVVGVIDAVPYARRRELGFSGMTDSLGRYYANDPGQYYLKDALQANLTNIAVAFAEQSRLAIAEMAAAGGTGL